MNSLPTPRFPIAVVLATYNGARYLEEQLDSLWEQTRQDFELVVRDDGSTDGTNEILRQTAEQRPDRVRIVATDLQRAGPKASFAALLQHTDARWIAFCDQDDYWMPDKLARQVEALEALERQHGPVTPLLCCGDAAVTDSQLRVVAPSFFDRHDISTADGRDLALTRLLFRNFAIGATTMINGALAARCRQIPDEAIMHDWWCALIASVDGHTVVLQDALIRYRQHAQNAVGSRRRVMPRNMSEFREYVQLAQVNSARCVRQALALRQAVKTAGPAIAASSRAVLDDYALFPVQSRWARLRTLLRRRSFKPGLALNGLHLYATATAPIERQAA